MKANLYSNQGRINYKKNTNLSMYTTNFLGAESPESELKIKGPSLFNGFDGSIKGDFNGIKVDFELDEKVMTLLDRQELTGKYEIDNKVKTCDLKFKQKFNIAHTYGIYGNFGDKNVDIRFENPLIKYSDITGNYNSKSVNLKVDRKLSNLIRNQYYIKGEINNKKVDLNCKGLFFFGGSIEGTFDGKPVKFETNQKINPFVDKRDITAEFDLNNDDKEDLLFLCSAITVNSLYLHH